MSATSPYFFDLQRFEGELRTHAAKLEELLEELTSGTLQSGEKARPPRLMGAIRHGLLDGGKRVRPFLVSETARLFGGDPEASVRVGAAVECIHSYSLIHDDLPAMDNDDLRRGKPTVHKAFGEATAILAGDALLTDAFAIVADDQTPLPAQTRIRLVAEMARAAGLGGMVGGQMLDMEAETVAPDENGVILLQAMKTGALIRFSCLAGALVGEAPKDDERRVIRYGEAVGLAFQIADDLLDETASSAQLGKTAGKDKQAGKVTLVSLRGQDWARNRLRELVDEADDALAPFDRCADTLRSAARFFAERMN